MLKLYGSQTPMFYKAVLVAEEAGLKYETVAVDISKQETRTPEHKKRHPFGKVPALEHNGRFVFESNAIARYLCEISESTLYPKDAYERAIVNQWMDYFSLQLGRWTTGVWYQKCVVSAFFKQNPDEKVIAENIELINTSMPIVNEHFAHNKYLAGDQLTLADLNAWMLMSLHIEAGLNLNDYPNFTRWRDAIASRPAAKKVMEMRKG